jgi:hypothetical protein
MLDQNSEKTLADARNVPFLNDVLETKISMRCSKYEGTSLAARARCQMDVWLSCGHGVGSAALLLLARWQGVDWCTF